MRALLPMLGLPLGLALWVASLWFPPPYGVRVHLEPRQAASTARHDTHWLTATVTAPLPGLEAVAVGDAVAFDRYGLLAPEVGQSLCVAVPAGHLPITLTALGGLMPHGNRTQLAVASVPPAACER